MCSHPDGKTGSRRGHSDTNSADGQDCPTISIVVPAYCEEGNLHRLHEELTRVLAALAVSWELIVVDDGSTDGTWQEIVALCDKDARVRGLRFSRNFGHQYALFAGLSWASGRAAITMDADLQHSPDVIPQMLVEWQNGHKVVHTVRIDHESVSRIKKTTSRFFYKFFSLLSGVKVAAGMADFRLLDRQVIDDILCFQETGLFLRGLIHWAGYPSSKIEFRSRERFAGDRKYTLLRSLGLAWTGITSFSLVPLRIATVLGVVTGLLAFSELAYVVWAKLYGGRTVAGWASAVGVVSFLFGVVFVILGVQGEYIGRILSEVRGRPRFIIDQRVGFVRHYSEPPKRASISCSGFRGAASNPCPGGAQDFCRSEP